MMSNYLIFLLAGRPFGVKLLGALEILPWRGSRQVPLSYSYVEGIIDYRGTVYAVFDLAQRLGMSNPGPIGFTAEEKSQAGGGRSILLLQENKESFGIIVDSVIKMTKLEELTPAPEKTQGIDPKYIRGVVTEDDQEILIFDFERLLHAG